MKKLLLLPVLVIITVTLCRAQYPSLYGMSSVGGAYSVGNILKTTVSGSESDVYDFPVTAPTTNGSYPFGSLIQGSNGLLYGMTSQGGASEQLGAFSFIDTGGVLFSYDTTSGAINILHSFGSASDGVTPYGSLVLAVNGKLYGMTSAGGVNNKGIIFSYAISSGNYAIVHEFGNGDDGATPYGSLIQATNGLLYGMTSEGGINGYGMVFSLDTTTNNTADIHDFNDNGTDGFNPYGSLLQVNNKLYGMTQYGGTGGSNFSAGIIFSIDISNGTEIIKHNFTGDANDGANPMYGELIEGSNGLLYGLTMGGGANGVGVLFSFDTTGAVETDIHDFGGTNDGQNPMGSPVEVNGYLYGLTAGVNINGSIFSFEISSGTETIPHSFGGYSADGSTGNGAFVQASNGKLYALTEYGGSWNEGTIVSYDISTFTEAEVYSFFNYPGCVCDGATPTGSLVQSTSTGLLYGMTPIGGVNPGLDTDGLVFSYNISTGMETVITDFYGPYGQNPYGSLIQVNDSMLYGMTSAAGNGGGGNGTIISINTNTNVFGDEYNFAIDTDGAAPHGSLLLADNGLLYGMTSAGGEYNEGIIFKFNTVTKTETHLHDFGGSNDGINPYGSLIEVNGVFYGMTPFGGVGERGMLFSLDTATNTYTDLHDFGTTTDGAIPNGSLLNVNGFLYGLTEQGGANEEGTIFTYAISTQNYSKLHDFGGTGDGEEPYGSFVEAGNGILYAMTSAGGANGKGTIISLNPTNSAYADIHDFSGADGDVPFGDLLAVPDSTTGVNQLAANTADQLTVYPNPTSGQFTVNLTGNQTGNTLEIYNVMGEQVYEGIISNSQNTINLSAQPAGLYFIYLKSDAGVEVGKVLVTK